MPYFRLIPNITTKTALLERGPGLVSPFTNWIRAVPWSLTVPEPLQIVVETKGRILPFYNNPVPVMKTNLLETIRKAGVDNIIDYAVEITNPFDGKVYKDYRAINIIGAIEAIDEDLSDGEDVYDSASILVGKYYDEIIVDETKIRGQLLFRLAEELSYIVISESIKDVILEKFSEDDVYFEALFEEDDGEDDD